MQNYECLREYKRRNKGGVYKMAKNYNIYEYGTSPRKLQPEYTPNRKPKQNKVQNKTKIKSKQNSKKQKAEQIKKKQQLRVSIYIAVGFIILFAISYRNSQIDEQFSAIQKLQGQLAIIEKENEQLEVNIENGSNLNNLEQSAKELLGMQKINNKQSVYVSLPKVNYIEGSEN